MNLNLNTFGFSVIEYNLSYPDDIAKMLSEFDYTKVYDKVNLLYISLTIGDNEINDPLEIQILNTCLNNSRILETNFLTEKELSKYPELINNLKKDLNLC